MEFKPDKCELLRITRKRNKLKRILPGVSDCRAVFEIRSDTGVICLFFDLFVTDLNISLYVMSCLFLSYVIYVGRPA
jgi:hypothetical protein